MTTHLRIILASLIAGAALSARAESEPARPASSRITSRLLTTLDADHNGILSSAEIAAAPMRLAALDLDDDGIIRPDEQRAILDGFPVRIRRSSASFNVLFALDANQDGDIQSMEVANAVLSLKHLDRNGDGELQPYELRPVMVARNR